MRLGSWEPPSKEMRVAITRHWKSKAQEGAREIEGRASGALPLQERRSKLDARSFERDGEDDCSRDPSAWSVKQTKQGAIRKRLGDLRALLVGRRRVFRLDGGAALTDAEWAALGISPFFAKLRDEGGGQGGGGCATACPVCGGLDGAAGARLPQQERSDLARVRDSGQDAS